LVVKLTVELGINLCVAARHVEKFGEVIPLGGKIITANTLNFKPIMEFTMLKIVRGIPVPGGMWVSKSLAISSACKHLSG